MRPGDSGVSPLRQGKDRVEALVGEARGMAGDRAKSDIEVTAACIGGALTNEDTPEAEAGFILFAYALLDLHCLTTRKE